MTTQLRCGQPHAIACARTRPLQSLPARLTLFALAVALALPATSRAATYTFAPVADSYTRSDAAASNYGNRTRLTQRNASTQVRHSYLRFNVTLLPGETIASARLELYSASSGSNLELRDVASDTWLERTITWNSAPVFGPVVTRSGSFSKLRTVALDATSVVKGAGLASVALTTTSSNVISLNSREASSNRPRLVVQTSLSAPGPDTTPPDTAINSEPPATTTATTASFSFSGSDETSPAAGLQFECEVDSAAYAACSPITTYSNLAMGAHSFAVRARDEAGNVDPSPAQHAWQVTAPLDTTPPDAPASLSASAGDQQASLTWSPAADNVGVTEYRLYRDGVQVAATSGTSQTDSGLVNGTAYSYTVKALDAAGNLSAASPAAGATPQAPAPQTTIDSGPSGPTSDSTPTFAFSSSASGAGFECRADAAAFAACPSPHTLAALADGAHVFEVRATDGAGNTDATPASRAFTVDTVAPATTITAAPAPSTTSTDATFSFAAEAGSAFACSLDGGAYTACTSPRTYAGLSTGGHSFAVRATDAVGNTDATPASHSWTIEAPPVPSGWSLVSEDDFDVLSTAAGGWSLYNSSGHAGNGLRRPEAFSIVDDPAAAGNKLLRVHAEENLAGDVVSGGMSQRANYTYGAFEARIRCEPDPSSTMSCVWLTWPQSGNWPADGENDIYETTLDPDRSPVKSFVHYGASNSQYYWSHPVDGTQWHVVRMEWTPATIKFFVDGVQSGSTLSDAAAIPDVPHHQTIQLDAFDNDLPAATNMYVDWVRVYQAAGADTTAPDTSITAGPSGSTTSTGATFQFASSESGSTFECGLDGAPYASCGGTIAYSALALGSHTFSVRARDAAGNTDPTPASRTWTIDAPAPLPSPSGDPVVVAAGDVACPSASPGTSSCGQKHTGDLIRLINPDLVLGLGDYQYDYGTLANFAAYYEPFWGSFKAKTRAINGGSHDFYGGGDYYSYFGPSAGPAPYASYSYDVGAWHLIALNNYCSDSHVGGCGVGSQWYDWLAADLAAHPNRCTLAYWHQPYWTSGASHAPYTAVADYVRLLYDRGVDVLLQAHNHQYERFAPQTPAGARDDARGIEAFVVGTGGRSFYGFNSTPAPNSLVRNADTFGVLQLNLHATSYDYTFKPIAGKTFTDNGTRTCS